MSNMFLYITHVSPHACSPTTSPRIFPARTICINTFLAINLPTERALPLNKCMTVVLRNSSNHSTTIAWPIWIMSHSQTANQRWRRALRKARQLVRLSRPYEKLEIIGPLRIETRFARKQYKHALNNKLFAIPEVCEANSDDPRRTESRRLKPPQRRNMQRKYPRMDGLAPIPEDCEVGFEDALKAEPQITENWKVKIHRAKPRWHWEVRDGFGQGERTSTTTTPSVILESLVALWINHGGSVVVMVLLGALASSIVC